MANYTSKYKLTKPVSTDLYDVEVHNKNMDTIDDELSKRHSLSNRGTMIPSGANLNDYTTPGDYFVSSANDASTITNTPTSGAGYRLIVASGYVPGYLRQYAIGMSGVMYTRHYQTSWSNWVKIVDTYDMLNSVYYHSTKSLSSEDLNTLTTPGFYYAGGSNTCANTPASTGSAFGLEVIRSAGSYYTQIAYVADAVYVRYYDSVTWRPWKQFGNHEHTHTLDEVNIVYSLIEPTHKAGQLWLQPIS